MNFERSQKEEDFVFGTRAVIEALKAGKEANKILVQKGLQGDLFRELRLELDQRELQWQMVPVEKLNKLTRKNHQGVIGFFSPVEYSSLDELVTRSFESGGEPLFVILDRVTDVRNFGAICRSAECMGVNGVIIPSRGSAMITSDAIKTSAGALHRLPVARAENLKDVIDYLKSSGIKVIACTEKSTKNVWEGDMKGPVALLFGSEEDGISPAYLKRCDEALKIPMKGVISSLNVSVSVGMVLYEANRQRLS